MDHDVLVAGETLVDFVPGSAGPLDSVSRFDRRPGGAPANVAVGLARLGRDPLFWTRLGDDPFGRYLDGVLADNGIAGAFVERDRDAKTALAFVTHDERGDRSFSFYRDGTADTRLEAGTVPDDVLSAVEWVHAGGVTLASGRAREATLDLLERASRANCVVSFDPNYRPELWSEEAAYARVVGEALGHVDVCKATTDELVALGVSGESPTDLARELVDGGWSPRSDGRGPHTAFVTRGSAGAVAVGSDRSPWPGVAVHAGYDVDAVDATGAGDAFVVGAIESLLDGVDLAETLAVANAVGAAATTATGGMTALPSRDAVRSVRTEGSSESA